MNDERPPPNSDEGVEPAADGSIARNFEISLAASLDAPARARAGVTAWLGQDGLGGTLTDDARLLVSELVTNCVRHALITPDELLRLTATLRAEILRLALHDDGTGGTVAWRTPQQHNGGYGLDLVAQLSSAWGVERDAHGTTVWLELATRRLDKPAAPRPRADRPNLRVVT
jgi:anti-sigma regulatory factor (Ser/Thr protein kinase)